MKMLDTTSDGDGNLDAVDGMICGTCGSGKHGTHACDVDLSKLKCFKCQKYGHISANCPERKKGKGKGVIKGKGKQKGKKGKGKGFGKKGKMNEVGYENEYDGTMVLGGRTSLGLKHHRFGMAIGMNHGIVHGARDRRTGMKLGVGQWEKMLCMTAMLVEQLLQCNLSY